MNEYFETLIKDVRKDERDKVFSAMDTLLQDRKTWNVVDVFNINDFKQSIILELKKQDGE